MKLWNPERALELIEREGRTRAWLASQCRIEEGTLKQILLGNRRPSRPVAKLMADALKATEAELLGEETQQN